MKRNAKVLPANYDDGREGEDEEDNKRPRPRTHLSDRHLKEQLRRSIIDKRQAQGQQEMKVEFTDPEQSELTPEERARREKRREQNRRAAQRCREKKRMLESSHVQSRELLLTENRELRREVNRLRQQLEELTRIRHLLTTSEISWSAGSRDLLGPDLRSSCMFRQSRDEAAGGVTSDTAHVDRIFVDDQHNAPPSNLTPHSSSPRPGAHHYPGLVQLLSEAAPSQVVPSFPAFTFVLTDHAACPILDDSWTAIDGPGLSRHRCMSGTSTISSDTGSHESEPSDYRLPCSSFSDDARVGSESSESCGGVRSEAVTAYGELDHSHHGEVPDEDNDDVFEAWGQHHDPNNNNPSYQNNNRVIPLDQGERSLAQAADANELNISSVFDDVILPFDDELLNLNPNDPNFLMEFEV